MAGTEITELSEKLAEYEDIIDSIPIGMLTFSVDNDVVKVISVNSRLVAFSNYVHTFVKDSPANWNKDTLMENFSKDIYAFAKREDRGIVKEFVQQALARGYGQCVFRLRGTRGENTKWIGAFASSKTLKNGVKMVYVLFLDNTNQVLYEKELQKKQQKLEEISRFDSLTGVQNRYYYNVYVEECKGRILYNTGIIFGDINGLKTVNDKYGHRYGDKTIQQFAAIIKRNFDMNCIYRISGDEFVIVLEKIDVNEFEDKVKHLIDEISDSELASIGYLWQTTIIDIRQEVYKAEQLMYIQKQKYYRKNKDSVSKHRPKMLNELMEEMDNNRYTVFLQPKAGMDSNRIIGAEALVRKIDTNGDIILPYEFIPMFEKELLISKIDFFVLEEVCKILAEWEKRGLELIEISTNMSRVTVAEYDFIEHVNAICTKYNVDSQYIEIEITESTDTKDDRQLKDIVNKLHTSGLGVSLDDMGNDYSSLQMLLLEGIDVVKLDRSFVLKIHEKQGNILMRYVISMCHELGMKCIAEGVEDLEQLRMLQDMNCDYYQGFLLSKPVPIPEFEKMM